MPDPEQIEQARRALASKRPAAALEILAGELALKTPAPAALLVAGRAEQALGRFERAADFLNRSLRAAPENAEAHHVLGNVQQDLGRTDRAIASYRRALRIEPALSAAENDLGTALFAKGWHKQAAEAFERCIALDPANARALENLGSALRALGQYAPARRAFQRAFWTKVTAPVRKLLGVRAAPREAPKTAGEDVEATETDATAKSAYLAYLAGDYAQAERLCAARLEQAPDDATALLVRALTLNQGERHGEALAILDLLAQRSPNAAEVHDARGTALRGLRRYDAALESFNRSLALKPQSAVTHSNVSALMIDKADYLPAETAARAALQVDPKFAPAMVNLGVALLAQDRPAEAEVELRRAVEVNPRSIKASLRLCEAFRDQDRLDDMRRELARAATIAPDNPDLELHLGLLSQDIERDVPRAMAHFHKAQQLAPQNAGPYLNEALLRLMSGEVSRRTWDLYEWRKRLPDRAEGYGKVALPEWQGERLGPGELLVYGEQGLGDEIMFASMLPQAIERAPRPFVAAQPRLRSLFARSFPGAEVFAWDRTLGAPDTRGARFATAIGSLGRYFRCSPGDFPHHRGYLVPDQERSRAMRARLDALGPGRKIGISWRGGVPLTWRMRRSLRLADLVPVLQRPGCRWINLQYGDVGGEIERLRNDSGVRVEQLHDATNDFEESAALVASLDLVISVCNTTVHLSGALGRPVWGLAPLAAEWRYGMDGDAMPWYPSVELIRQEKHGDWPSVFARVVARLDAAAPAP